MSSLKPLPIATMVITEAIPMTIPSIVNKLRRLFFKMERKAVFQIIERFMSAPPLKSFHHEL